jgi:hypothetical protein
VVSEVDDRVQRVHLLMRNGGRDGFLEHRPHSVALELYQLGLFIRVRRQELLPLDLNYLYLDFNQSRFDEASRFFLNNLKRQTYLD